MSFGRNLQAVFGVGSLYEGMADAPLDSVSLSDDKETIAFKFENGTEIRFGVEGDCCSSSWIEHLEVPNDIKGSTLESVEDGKGVPWDGHSCEQAEGENVYGNKCGHDCLAVYNTRFRTQKGDIVLEYRNDSNGYYGGYLVRQR